MVDKLRTVWISLYTFLSIVMLNYVFQYAARSIKLTIVWSVSHTCHPEWIEYQFIVLSLKWVSNYLSHTLATTKTTKTSHHQTHRNIQIREVSQKQVKDMHMCNYDYELKISKLAKCLIVFDNNISTFKLKDVIIIAKSTI